MLLNIHYIPVYNIKIIIVSHLGHWEYFSTVPRLKSIFSWKIPRP